MSENFCAKRGECQRLNEALVISPCTTEARQENVRTGNLTEHWGSASCAPRVTASATRPSVRERTAAQKAGAPTAFQLTSKTLSAAKAYRFASTWPRGHALCAGRNQPALADGWCRQSRRAPKPQRARTGRKQEGGKRWRMRAAFQGIPKGPLVCRSFGTTDMLRLSLVWPSSGTPSCPTRHSTSRGPLWWHPTQAFPPKQT